MSDIVDQLKELPTWAKIAIVIGAVLITIPLLLVLIVILSAVIGAFLLGAGDDVHSSAPVIEFQYNHNPETNKLLVTHAGGDAFNADNIGITVEDRHQNWSDSGRISPGDSTIISEVSTGDTVQITWTHPDTSETIALSERTIQ